MNPGDSPYPRGEACPRCGVRRLEGQICWRRRERSELKLAGWIILLCGATGIAAWMLGGAFGGAALILRPFGLVLFLGALLSALFILADELKSRGEHV